LWPLSPVNALHDGRVNDDEVSTTTSFFFSSTGLLSRCCHCLPRCANVLPLLMRLIAIIVPWPLSLPLHFAAVVPVWKPCISSFPLLLFVQATVTAAGLCRSVGNSDGVSAVAAS